MCRRTFVVRTVSRRQAFNGTPRVQEMLYEYVFVHKTPEPSDSYNSMVVCCAVTECWTHTHTHVFLQSTELSLWLVLTSPSYSDISCPKSTTSLLVWLLTALAQKNPLERFFVDLLVVHKVTGCATSNLWLWAVRNSSRRS